jgi:hypothetical protein
MLRALGVVLATALVTQCGSGGTPVRDRLLAEWSRDGIVPITAPNADGTQSLAVLASRGYFPVTATAKADVASMLRIYTHETYDCSRAFVIPELRLRRVLPPSGVVEISILARPRGATLFGTCSMGMYTFTVAFE